MFVKFMFGVQYRPELSKKADAKLTQSTHQFGRGYASALTSVCVSSDTPRKRIFLIFCSL